MNTTEVNNSRKGIQDVMAFLGSISAQLEMCSNQPNVSTFSAGRKLGKKYAKKHNKANDNDVAIETARKILYETYMIINL